MVLDDVEKQAVGFVVDRAATISQHGLDKFLAMFRFDLHLDDDGKHTLLLC